MRTPDSGDGYRETKTMNEHITNFPVQKGILLTLRVCHEKMILQHSSAFCSIALPAPYSLSLALKIPLRCCETSQASHLEFSQNFNWIYVSWIGSLCKILETEIHLNGKSILFVYLASGLYSSGQIVFTNLIKSLRRGNCLGFAIRIV